MGLESYLLGKQGEDTAEVYLSQQGYKILERNFRSQQGEIDIIAKDKEIIAFIEVKSYSFRSWGTPRAAVRKPKRASIIHAAKYYLYKNKIKNTNCRFDVLSIYRRKSGERAIDLIKGAFYVN